MTSKTQLTLTHSPMNLDRTLDEYAEAERTSLTVVYQTKLGWKQNLFFMVNRMPEKVMFEWLVTFLVAFHKGEQSLEFKNCSWQLRRWPLQLSFKPTQIKVGCRFEYRTESGDRLDNFLLIDGPKSSIAEFRQLIIARLSEYFSTYSPDKDTFCVRAFEG